MVRFARPVGISSSVAELKSMNPILPNAQQFMPNYCDQALTGPAPKTGDAFKLGSCYGFSNSLDQRSVRFKLYFANPLIGDD